MSTSTPASPVKAIFFDIDGTLVSFKTHRVPHSTLTALQSLREAGVKLFIATGRMLSMIGLLDGIPFDAYITCNGAFCVDQNRNVIYADPIPAGDLAALADLLDRESIPVSFMSEEKITVNFVNERVCEAVDMIGLGTPQLCDVREAIRQTIFQICIYVNDEKAKMLMNEVMTHCAYSRWTPHFADVNARGNSKQTGVDRILAHYGLRIEETMAFGDGGNDIPMLRHVAMGVAMGNANDDVKTAAAYVTTSVDDDGISRALEHFKLI